MKLDSFTGPGSTPSRRRFWDKVTAAVVASQKVAGRFVTVDEHPGKGSVINTRRPTPPGTTGACCDDEGNCTITTEAECTGTFQGIGTVCDPNPCGGGCSPCAPPLFVYCSWEGDCYTGQCVDCDIDGCNADPPFGCEGEIVNCHQRFHIDTEYCCCFNGGGGYTQGGIVAIQTFDRVTCEETVVTFPGDCESANCGGFGDTGEHILSVPYVPCDSDTPGACWTTNDMCIEMLPQDCNLAGGAYQGDGTSCP